MFSFILLMVVKEKTGRKRYIVLFCSQKREDLEDFLKEIRMKYQIKTRIILYYNGFSIIKFSHLDKDRFVHLLMLHNLKTYKVTGSVKKAKEILNMIKY